MIILTKKCMMLIKCNDRRHSHIIVQNKAVAKVLYLGERNGNERGNI